MRTRSLRWTVRAVGVVAALVVLRVLVAFVAPQGAPPPPPVAMHGADLHGDPLPEGAVARLGTVRFRCAGPAIWGPDGTYLLAGGWNGEILAIDATTGLVDWTLPGHSEPFTPEIDLTDLDQVSRIIRRGELPQHHDTLAGLTLSPDGRELLSSGYCMRVWDLATRAETARILVDDGSTWGAAISLDGALAAYPGHNLVRVVDLAVGREHSTIHTDGQPSCVTWSHDGERLFVGLDKGRVAVLRLDASAPVVLPPSSDHTITAILLLDGEQELWTLDLSGVLAIRSMTDPGAAARRIALGPAASAGSWWGRLQASPDGGVVAVTWGYQPIRWFDATTAQPVAAPVSPCDVQVAIGWSPGGRRFAGWSRGALRVFGQGVPAPPDVHTGPVSAAVWSPDGSRIATKANEGCNDGTVRVWDVARGAQLWKFDCRSPVSSVAWTADGSTVIAARVSGIVGLDATTGEQRWNYPVAGKPGWRHLDPRGTGAFWLDEHRNLQILDLRSEPHFMPLTPLGTQPVTEQPPGVLLPGLEGAVLLETVPIEIRPDGSFLARGRLRVWRIGDSEPSSSIDVEGGNDVFALSRDGRFAVAGGNGVTVLDRTSTPPREVGRLLQARWCSAAALSVDASRLAIADAARTIHVYEVPALTEIRTLRGHRAQITCLAFSDDGTRLVSGSVDTTALVWDVR